MKPALVTSMFVACVVTLSGCATDAPTSVDVHWNLHAVHVIDNTGLGGRTEQIDGSCSLSDRATVYTQREGEPAQASPSSSCFGVDNQVIELPPGAYKIWVDLVTRQGEPFARSAIQQLDLTEAAQPVDLDMVIDGVFLQSTWKVTSVAGAPIGCPGPTVQLMTYRAKEMPCTVNNPCFTTTLPCAAGGGLFDAVPQDPYGDFAQLAVLDAQGAVIASSEPVAYQSSIANEIILLGELAITLP